LLAGLAVALVSGLVHAEPIGALGGTGDLGLTGDRPRRRVSGEVVLYVSRRYGLYAALGRATTAPWFDQGQATVGIALRVAAARPELDIVVHGDGGVAWPLAPVIGGGVATYFWPMKSVPVALTSGMRAYVIIDDVRDTQLAIALNVGLSLAR
jgi:hypothetical protein